MSTLLTNPGRVLGEMRGEGRSSSDRKLPAYLQQMAKDATPRGQQLYRYELARLGMTPEGS